MAQHYKTTAYNKVVSVAMIRWSVRWLCY